MGTQIVLALLRMLWPLSPPAADEPPMTVDERARLERWEVAVYGPATFVFVPTLIVAWFVFLKAASDVAYCNPPGTIKLIRAATIYWFLPAIPLGIFSAVGPTRWWAGFLLGERVDRFYRACNEQLGFEWGRVFQAMLGITLVGTLIYSAIVLHYYARLDRTGMEIGRHWSFARDYAPYRSIRRIEHRATWVNRNGRRVKLSRYLFEFEAIPPWTLRPEYGLGPQEQGRIADWIARRAGRQIIERP